MESESDYTKYKESELVDLFGRMDPRWVPADCARLKEFLVERGYIVRDGGLRPGSAVPSPDKLQTLIGSPRPIECEVTFGQTTGLFRWLEPAHNDLGLVGSGTLRADGVYVRLSGRRAGALPALFGSLFDRRVELTWHGIADVESDESHIHFTYRTPDFPSGAITLGFPDRSVAERLAAALPRERKADFRPQLQANVEFERRLIAQSPQTPVTVGLVAINFLVFLAMVLSGHTPIAWGCNFGPYTTDGEWWRLFTSLFLHFSVLHILFNMWALAAFGPLAERLYGSVNYLLLYLVAGVTGSLASISWQPDVTSAGASGAIFGVLGALLAAQLRVGDTSPSNIVRPLRNSTLVFASCALLFGFMHAGVDNAAHLGGLAAGFLLGLLSARPINDEPSQARGDVRRLLQMVPLAIVLLVGGVWFAQRASATLVGEGLYWHTIHWFRAGERSANSKYNAALVLAKADKGNLLALTDRLDNDILPFWREASARLSAINLAPTSPNFSALQLFQSQSEGRVHAYKLFAEGLRNNDSQEIGAAELELNRLQQTNKDSQSTVP
jgi:rhomboid protease GluP